MFEFISQNRPVALGLIITGFMLILGTTAASASGMGADTPPAEAKRGQPVYHGGHFFIFYGGGPNAGPRGLGGRGGIGGGFGAGK